MQRDLSFPDHFIYIDFLAVRTPYQRQGRGKMLLEEIISYSEKVHLPLMLFTDATEQVHYYQNLGFRAVGITSSKKFKYINTYLVREVHSGND
nr:GNAT family N-acetyltransferase [Clostridium aminobutyricum]